MAKHNLPARGAGLERMKRNLGTNRAEELRLQVLRDQEAALGKANAEQVSRRDRTSYTDYPRATRRKE